MEKLALRAGFKAMQRAGERGDADSVADLWRQQEKWKKPETQLATTMSPLERAQGGRTYMGLGGGSEGVADVVLNPDHGVVTRKTFDPEGMATAETRRRKRQMGKAENPAVAKYHGAQVTPQGGGEMHFNELVAGRGRHPEPAPGSPAQTAALEKAHAGVQQAAKETGFEHAADVVPDNMKWDSHDPRYKSFDSLPAKKKEFMKRDVHGNDAATGKLPVTDAVGLSEEQRRRMLMADPKSTWWKPGKNKAKMPINPTGMRGGPEADAALRKEMLGIKRVPNDPRPTKAQRQQAALNRVRAKMPGGASLNPSAFQASPAAPPPPAPSAVRGLASELEPTPRRRPSGAVPLDPREFQTRTPSTPPPKATRPRGVPPPVPKRALGKSKGLAKGLAKGVTKGRGGLVSALQKML